MEGVKKVAYIAGGAGLVVGAVAGVVGALGMSNDPKRPARKHLAAVRLDQRLKTVEQKLGRVSRIKDYLDDYDVYDRVNTLERRVRSASAGVRSEATGRPKWMVKLADFIAGA